MNTDTKLAMHFGIMTTPHPLPLRPHTLRAFLNELSWEGAHATRASLRKAFWDSLERVTSACKYVCAPQP